MSGKRPEKSRKRRWLIAAAVLGALVLGWLVYAIMLSPSAAIRQAEAFLFRRMTVVRLDEGQYRYFYVSNRRLEPGGESIEDRVTDERDENLCTLSDAIVKGVLTGTGGSPVENTSSEVPVSSSIGHYSTERNCNRFSDNGHLYRR